MKNNSSTANVKIKSSESQGIAHRLGLQNLILGIFVAVFIGSMCINMYTLSVIHKHYEELESNHTEFAKMYEATKKQVWELKTAFNLQFSDERSRAKQNN